MLFPIAIKDCGSHFEVKVPDVSALDITTSSMAEAVERARSELISYLRQLKANGESLPVATDVSEHLLKPEFSGWTWAVITIDKSRIDSSATQAETQTTQTQATQAQANQTQAAQTQVVQTQAAQTQHRAQARAYTDSTQKLSTVRLEMPEELLRQIVVRAKQEGLTSKSQLVIKAVAAYLER